MSYAAFVSSIANMTIGSITKKYAYPPASISSADLPVQWVQMPRSDEESPMTLAGKDGWVGVTVDLIIALVPVSQGDQSANFDAAIKMMDTVRAALGLLAASSKTKLRWQISQTGVNVAGVDYWAVKATVSGKV